MFTALALTGGAALLGLLLGAWTLRLAQLPADGGPVTGAHLLPGPRWLHLLPAALGGALLPWLTPVWSFWALSQLLLLFALLYALAVVDATSLTVDLPVLFGGLALRLAGLALLHPPLLVEMLGGLLAGAGLFSLVGLAYRWLRGREGLGEGDAAVMGLVGAFVGWEGLFPAVFAAAFSGLVLGGGALLLSRRSLATPLPLVPFLALGGLTVYLAQSWGWSALRLLAALPSALP